MHLAGKGGAALLEQSVPISDFRFWVKRGPVAPLGVRRSALAAPRRPSPALLALAGTAASAWATP